MFGLKRIHIIYFISGLTCGLFASALIQGNEYMSYTQSIKPHIINQSSPRMLNLVNDTPQNFSKKFLARPEDKERLEDAPVGEDLYDKVRVLCWVQTYEGNLWSKALHVRNTWGKRCNIVLFMSDSNDTDFPALGLGTDLGRKFLIAKAKRAFDYIYKHHLDDADWFLKADPDTYLILENMRYFLGGENPEEPIFFGYPYKVIVDQGYFAGGPSYVWSKEALRRFGKRDNETCPWEEGSEDVHTGKCMERLKVNMGDVRDSLNKTRFHVFDPNTHIHGGFPKWYYPWSRHAPTVGIGNMSTYTVSFHYVSPEKMYGLEYLIYNSTVHGRTDKVFDLNKNHKSAIQ